jgi:hypothetical protein
MYHGLKGMDCGTIINVIGMSNGGMQNPDKPEY